MKRAMPTFILALLAVGSSAWAQEPGEAKTSTAAAAEPSAEATADSTAETVSKTAAEPEAASTPKATESVEADDDVWSSKYDELDHVMVLERIDNKADDVQRKIAALKDRVDLLRESVVVGSITPSRTIIVHKSELGASFDIESLEYKLDGEVIFTKSVKDGAINVQQEFEVLNGFLTPGEHLFEVGIVLKGSGRGFFAYFLGYRFRLSSKYRLTVAEGRLTKLVVTPYPRPDVSLKPKDRLAIKYDIGVQVNRTE
jgi:hypothetical protein